LINFRKVDDIATYDILGYFLLVFFAFEDK